MGEIGGVSRSKARGSRAGQRHLKAPDSAPTGIEASERSRARPGPQRGKDAGVESGWVREGKTRRGVLRSTMTLRWAPERLLVTTIRLALRAVEPCSMMRWRT